MALKTNAPKQITWMICLVLFIVALLTHFGVVSPGGQIGTWSWIIGFGLLLLANLVREL